ncbi:MAG TPA: hypothetical protein VGM29_13335 [Polyangiaceae bacterium]|jgi:hypothetical protein
MARRNEEIDHPAEWLRALFEDASAFERLVTESGGMAHAAYRLARARCRASAVPTALPTLGELQAAALILARRVGAPETLPIKSLLASECESQGLAVIRPIAPLPAHSAPPPPSMRMAAARRA